MNTAHVSSFVLISILRGQPRTPPSCENLGVLDYHRNSCILSSFLPDPPVLRVVDPDNSKTREDVDTVTITCTANAKPSSFTAVEWYRGSQRITITGRYMDGTPQRPSLTIKPVKRVDSGKYTCKIQNEIGWGNKTTNLALVVTCKLVQFPCALY